MSVVRIFIDSNTLISALVFGGNELKCILNSLKRGHELVISEHIVEEVYRTIIEKFPEHTVLFHEFLKITNIEILPKTKYIEKIEMFDILRDKHDKHVLACAVTAHCDMIITGDKDLLILKECKGIPIFTAKRSLSKI